eukprot:6485053-Amphidinium_carterae.1
MLRSFQNCIRLRRNCGLLRVGGMGWARERWWAMSISSLSRYPDQTMEQWEQDIGYRSSRRSGIRS